jgi:adenine/guanine phosphoribosyltransferase-like PRPP-binding protein
MLRIHVTDRSRPSGNKTISFADENVDPRMSEIIYYPIAQRQDLATLAETMYRDIPVTVRRLSRRFVIRAHAAEAPTLFARDSAITEDLAARFIGASFTLLHDGDDGQPRLTSLFGDPAVPEALIAHVRSAELQTLADQPSALLPVSDSFHYLGPNGRHYRSFLRAGIALQNSVSLDAACFWLTSHLARDTVIVVDSPTLIGLGHGLAQYARDNRSRGAVHTVEVLERPDESAALALAKRLVRIKDVSLGLQLHVLCLGSVLSSGGSLELMHDAVRKAKLPSSDVVLYRSDPLDRSAISSLAVAPDGVVGVEECELCSDVRGVRSVPIPIDPVSLHAELNGAITRQRMTRQFAEPAKEFLELYAGHGVVSVHATEEAGHRRHHAVDVDAIAMLAVPRFRDKLAKKIDALNGFVDMILCPEHPAARQLAQEVAQGLGVPMVEADENHLDSLTEDEQSLLRSSSSLLIVDDVVISGDRLRGYRQFLFELGRSRGDVHVLVALSRPSSDDEKIGIRNLADQMSTTERSFHPVEEILLPNWGKEECPWCVEELVLRNYAGEPPEYELSDELVARLELLDSGPIGPGAFWSADGSPLVLGEGSVFAPAHANDAELFLAVASTIQEMRSRGLLDEDFRPPVSKLLTHEFWIRGRFYAPGITAAILRAARRHDLVPPQPPKALATAVAARLSEAASHSVKWEVLLAITLGKLPLPVDAPTGEDSQIFDDVVAGMFRTLLGDSR